ncbi:MAG: molybdopterin-dependent oxidoreductase [Deltaproteobacteria bacterium]|nr:molybdopterin-dependent oxidoreductase [Deltaproteobacteria bacterium]
MATTKGAGTVRFNLNGEPQEVPLRPKYMLLEYLRDEGGLMGAKEGCSEGHCGTCTVLVNGKAELACIFRMDRLEGASIETVENLAKNGDLHPVQQALVDSGAVQCGFCTPGIVMAAKGLLDKKPDPTEAEIRSALNRNLCRCGTYPKVIQAVQTAAATLRGDAKPEGDDWSSLSDVVGKPVPKLDAPAKVRGEFVYADDMVVEGMVFGKIVWSEHPHAETTSIDTTQAEAAEGVLAILTAKDVPGRNLYGTLEPDQPVFCDEKVRFIGDVIALVVAETEAQAAEAAAAVRVEYRIFPGVFSPEEALAEGASKVHEKGNVHARLDVTKGDVDAGFVQADVVVEESFSTPFIEHAFLEPESGLATIDDDGVITIKMASQFLTAHRGIVAESLGLPPEKLNLVHVQPGGAFGAKGAISLHILLGLATLKTGRPVKMTLTRAESLRSHPKRHPMKVRMKMGATKEGKLTAIKADICADTGAYAAEGIVVIGQAAVFCGGPYVIPNVSTVGTTVYTNNTPAGAMRGFGIPQVAFATEVVMDELARRLEIDPFEFRELNAVEEGSVSVAGQTLRGSVPLKETISLAREAVKKAPPLREGWNRGVGVACGYKNVGVGLGLHLDSGGARLEISLEGQLLVSIGGVDLGQGSDTTLAQIAAQATGVTFGQVQVAPVDVFSSPDGGVTSASRTTYVSGNALVKAGEKLRAALIDYAAGQLDTDPANVVLRNGLFSNGGDNSLGLKELAERAAADGVRFTADHHYDSPPTQELWRHGPPEDPDAPEGSDFYFSYSYATQVAVVDVDEHSGEVKVVKIVAAHDVGRAINPPGVEGQIEGSCLMGMGFALSEEFKLDHGYLVTDNLKKCHLPTFKECPEIVTIIVEDEEPSGPHGAKGIAEAAVIPTAPAIINAIRDAIGVTMRDLPATPTRLLDAMHGKTGQG